MFDKPTNFCHGYFLTLLPKALGKGVWGKTLFAEKVFPHIFFLPPISKVFEEGCGEKTFSKKFLPAINLLSQIPLKREKWNKLFYF